MGNEDSTFIVWETDLDKNYFYTILLSVYL